MLDDEIDNKAINYLETYAEQEPDLVSPPITANDVKDHVKNLLSIRQLIENKSCQVSP